MPIPRLVRTNRSQSQTHSTRSGLRTLQTQIHLAPSLSTVLQPPVTQREERTAWGAGSGGRPGARPPWVEPWIPPGEAPHLPPRVREELRSARVLCAGDAVRPSGTAGWVHLRSGGTAPPRWRSQPQTTHSLTSRAGVGPPAIPGPQSGACSTWECLDTISVLVSHPGANGTVLFTDNDSGVFPSPRTPGRPWRGWTVGLEERGQILWVCGPDQRP